MPLYETTLVIDSTLEESVVAEKVQKTVELLTASGATDIRPDRRGVRRLAYDIKGKDGQMRPQADYTFLFYRAPGSAVGTLEAQLRLDEDVLRYMTVRYDYEPSAAQEGAETRKAAEADGDRDSED